MRPQGYDKEDLQNALNVLNEGGIILYPTDTIWGIGCDANNSEAVQRIYDIKQRSDSKSMLVLVNSINMVERYIDELPEVANDLLEVTDKPLTIIYDNAKNLAKNLIAEDGSIGIRVTDELFSNHLITRFKRPIVSTSANVSGKNSPKNFQFIDQAIKDSVDYIVKYRNDDNSIAKASGIIRLKSGGQISIIRE